MRSAPKIFPGHSKRRREVPEHVPPACREVTTSIPGLSSLTIINLVAEDDDPEDVGTQPDFLWPDIETAIADLTPPAPRIDEWGRVMGKRG